MISTGDCFPYNSPLSEDARASLDCPDGGAVATYAKKERAETFPAFHLMSVSWFPRQQTGVKGLPFPLLFPTLAGQGRVRDGQSRCWHTVNGRRADKELKSHAVSVKPAPICHLRSSHPPQACGVARRSSSTADWTRARTRQDLLGFLRHFSPQLFLLQPCY